MDSKFCKISLFELVSSCQGIAQLMFFFKSFQTLTLDDMIKMEHAKFMFKFENNMLPSSFNNYFTKLENVLHYNARQKSSYFHHQLILNLGA